MDIQVEDIIKTFKGVKRETIYSTAQTDDFLTIIQAKEHWTLQEYKTLYYAYYTETMHVQIMDLMRINLVADEYNFTTNWNDYFYILDNIKDENKQAKYADYYFWYHGDQLTEEVYLEFIKKTYYSKVSKDSRVRFLENNVKTDNSLEWIDKHFSLDDIKSWLESNNLRFSIRIKDDNWNISQEKINKVKKFYNNYEKHMSYNAKLKFFNEAIERGSVELIQFLYVEKGIRLKAKDKMVMFWHLCGDTSVGNVVEMLTELRIMGMKFTPYDLKRTKKHNQWGYMEHTEKLEQFFDMLQKEKDYKTLTKKLKTKSVNSTSRVKIQKI